ncbi:MAG: hypothetical protein ACLQNE_28260 [Thermoguttaceae bacterium]
MSSIPPSGRKRSVRAEELFEAARNAQREDRGELAYRLLSQCLEAASAVNDTPSVARALIGLVENTSLFAPSVDEDIFQYRERLCLAAIDHFRAIQEPEGMADALRLLAREKPIPEAKILLEQALGIMRRAGNVAGIIKCLDALGHFAVLEGNRQFGRTLKNEALALARDEGDSESTARVLFSIALGEEGTGNARAAMFEEAARRFEELGLLRWQAKSLAYCAMLACEDSQMSLKESHLRRAIEICGKIGNEALERTCYDALAEEARKCGDEPLARSYESRGWDASHLPQDKALCPTELNLETLRDLMRRVIGTRHSG